MKPVDPGMEGPAPAPRPLGYWAGVVLERWWVVLLVAAAVFAWRSYDNFVASPVYLSQASVKLETPPDPATGLAALYGRESVDSMLSAEMHTLRSRRVAEAAAALYTLPVTLWEVNSWRPLETALVDVGLRAEPCVVAVSHAPGLQWARAHAYRVTFDGPGGAPQAAGEAGQPPAWVAQPAGEGAWTLTLDGQAITLKVVQGDPKDRDFTLAVRTPGQVSEWLRRASMPSSAGAGTGVILVGCSGPTPVEAQAGATALALAFEQVRDEDAREASRARQKWLGDQRNTVLQGAQAAEQRYDEHVASSGALMLGEQAKGLVEDLGRLLSTRLVLEQELSAEREALGELEGTTDPDEVILLLGSTGADTTLSAWAQRIAALEAERGAMMRLEAEASHPSIKRLQAEIDEVRERLAQHVARARARAIALQQRKIARVEGRIDDLAKQREGVQQRLRTLPAEQRASERLEREAKVAAESYEQILRWQKEAELKGVTEESNVRQLDGATLPQSRLSPVLSKVFTTAVGMGVMLGIFVALFLHWRDRTVRAPDDLETATGLPLFGAIPDYGSVPRSERQGLKGPLPSVDLPDSVITEAYRSLRANLRFASVDRPVQAFAITSAQEKEGKTTTSLNLAVVMAQAGARVVIVDADMRRPSVHTYTRQDLAPGLAQVLAEGRPWREVVNKGVHGLDVISAGARPPNPGALLESEALAALLADLRANYDYVLFDVPPMLATVDASGLFAKLDGVLLLSRAGRVPGELAHAARERIERIGGRVLGCVFNAFDARKGSRAYGYRYGYAYRYGYRYGYRSYRPEPEGAAEAPKDGGGAKA